MKRLFCVWMVLLLLFSAVPAAAAQPLTYESDTLAFSLTLPGLTEEDVTLEERAGGVDVYHTPSREQWDGLMGSIEVVSPRSAFFSDGYDSLSYQILAMGTDRVYLWKSPGGGAATGGEELEDYSRVALALTTDALRANLQPTHSDSLPVLNIQRRLVYLTAEGSAIRPDDPLTRGELAQALYALLNADNKGASFANPFSDVTDSACAQAVGYLASYGILTGYDDGTFRPDAPVSRAAFAVALHRCQFAAPVGRYGSRKSFSDVSDGFWAGAYLDSALVLGWMSGYADGTFRPNAPVTRAQAATALNRVLGRDASGTHVVEGTSPFSDLPEDHWACANVLEAAGVLPEVPADIVTPPESALPQDTDAAFFLSQAEGWAACGTALRHTADGGRTWHTVGQPLTLEAAGLFFFNDRQGLLLGTDAQGAWQVLETDDGGETWQDFILNALWNLDFPTEAFPRTLDFWKAVVSARLRPAGTDTVYLTVRYTPYESIYARDFTAYAQCAVTVEELGHYAVLASA